MGRARPGPGTAPHTRRLPAPRYRLWGSPPPWCLLTLRPPPSATFYFCSFDLMISFFFIFIFLPVAAPEHPRLAFLRLTAPRQGHSVRARSRASFPSHRF